MRFSCVVSRILTLAAVVMTCARASAADHEKWYQVLMSNAHSGWMHAVEKTENGRISSTTELSLRIKRGPTEIGISVKSETVETTDGKPVSMKSTQTLG